MANWYDLGFKTENGNMQTSSGDEQNQVGSASGVANQNNVISNMAVFENGTKIKTRIKYNDVGGSTSAYGNIPYALRDYLVDVFVVDGNGTEYPCSSDYLLGKCASSISLPSYQTGQFKPFDFQSWGDYNSNTLRLNNAYNESMGVVNTIYPLYNIGGHSTSAPYYMSVNGDGDIEFIAYGEPCYTTSGNQVTPTRVIGKIPKSILDNPEIFDPTSGLRPEDIIRQPGGTGGRVPLKNYTGEDIDFPELPTGADALGFGRMNIYTPTSPQLAMALDILWSDASESTLETIIESAKKWWYKPEQYCVSMMLTPVPLTSGSSKKIYFGKYDTGVTSGTLNSQWAIVDCGTLSIPLMYGSYLDYDLTQAMLFLPFIGFRVINVKECMGGTMAIKYYVDMLTGSAVAFVRVSNEGSNNSILYTFECNVNTQVPITSNNYNTLLTNIQRATISAISTGVGVATGNPLITASAVGNAVGSVSDMAHSSSVPGLMQSGSLTANTGILGNSKPYIVLHFPVALENSNRANTKGLPSSNISTLGNFSGFTVCDEVHLDGIDLPREIKDEIINTCKRGIIL